MTTDADLAALMYPSMNDPTPEAAVPVVNALTQNLEHAEGRLLTSAERMYGDSNAPQPLPEVTVEQLTAEPLSAADLMYPDGGKALESVQDYDQQTLRESFESFEFKARHDGNDADSAALEAGRLQAATALHEMAVPSEAAHAIAGELEGWHSRWMANDLPDLDQMDATREQTEAALRKEWGPEYSANLELARSAYKDAAKRIPWLRNLVEEAGAGNSAALLRQFAKIGLSSARNRRGTVGNRS